jgi:putative nucleotidyltransferase with HDIG domain
MFPFRRQHLRREEVRKSRPDRPRRWWRALRTRDATLSLSIAAGFCVAAIAIGFLRESMVRYRPGQWTTQDVLARVDFEFVDTQKLLQERQAARRQTPRVYQQVAPDPLAALRTELLALPQRLAGKTMETVPPELSQSLQLDSGALTMFNLFAQEDRQPIYAQNVEAYVSVLQKTLAPADRQRGPILLNEKERQEDLERPIDVVGIGRVQTQPGTWSPVDPALARVLAEKARVFRDPLPEKIAAFTRSMLRPTHLLDERATAAAQNAAAEAVPVTRATVAYQANQVLVARDRMVSEHDGAILRAEQAAFVQSLGARTWKPRLGLAGVALLVTVAMSLYVARYQPRLLKNHARAVALAALLLSMLLLAQLAAIGTGSLYMLGVAPTILVAVILAVVYDQRFAQGIATIHALLTTAALDQTIGFFFILWVGVLTCCYLLNEVRSRSKLIEVGGMTALAMAAAAAAAGALQYDPLEYILKNCLGVAAAGLGVGFVVLGILPFIERIFRITTAMSLLELADVSQPLLKRLQMEAPGTYNHSLQVATLAEAAAEAIGAHGLLCRVGAYYHDIGKVLKSDYFGENMVEGQSRHLNLTPSVSRLIILAHVKDGAEMAKDYLLPTVLIPFIQQHHGTTLVEHFYVQAKSQRDPVNPDEPLDVRDTEYRYPGPRPRTREVAIVMVADVVESATRAMVEPTPGRVEGLVHELVRRRLDDGQFDDCALTLRDLRVIEQAMIRVVLGIHHTRMAYPTTVAMTHGPFEAETGMSDSEATRPAKTA